MLEFLFAGCRRGPSGMPLRSSSLADKFSDFEKGPISPLLSRQFRFRENWMARYFRVEEYETCETDIWSRERLNSDSFDEVRSGLD